MTEEDTEPAEGEEIVAEGDEALLPADEAAEELPADELTEEATDEVLPEEELIEETTDEETTEEAADEFALPDDASVDFEISFDEDNPTIGSVAHFKALVDGYEDIVYTLQWQRSLDCEAWEDVQDANGETMDVLMTEETSQYYWRLKIIIDVSENT